MQTNSTYSFTKAALSATSTENPMVQSHMPTMISKIARARPDVLRQSVTDVLTVEDSILDDNIKSKFQIHQIHDLSMPMKSILTSFL
jgi:hypothetical protein